VNEALLRELDQATDPWGVKVTRVELRDIQPSRGVQQAMEQQMTAEREKRAAILRSEGERESQLNAARGRAEALVLDAKAKETLENPGQPRENTCVIAVANWGHGRQAARFR
jgi:regulator of protease activity HflC (stomatin/prohibitin superfamily)